MIRLVSIELTGFRSFRHATVPFGHQTIIVGPNNSGKTALLDAIDGAFGVGRRGYGFSEDDVASDREATQGFSLLFVFRPGGDAIHFTDAEMQVFGSHIDVSDETSDRLLLRVVGHTEDDGIFRTRMVYMKDDGLEDGSVALAQREQLAFLMLPAVREGRREFGDGYGLWAKIGSLAAQTPELAATLEQMGRDYGAAVVDLVLGEETRGRLSGSVVESLSATLFANEAAPTAVFNLLSEDAREALGDVELRVGYPGDARERRMGQHSVGTQSVAVVGLFSAYLAAVRERVFGLGLEEPEAHLGPHATRTLVKRLLASELAAIVTTHSASVTDSADPRTLVVLRREAGATRASAVAANAISAADAVDISRRLSEAGSEFLFARVTLLAEGQSERLALPIFAASLGIDFDVLGISVAPVGGSSFKLFLTLLGPDALAIPHVVLCDNDAAATDLVRDLAALDRLPPGVDREDLAASRAAMAAAGYFYWAAGSFEQAILDDGGTPYLIAAAEAIWPGRLEKLRTAWNYTQVDDPEFLLRACRSLKKPQLLRRVAELMAEAAAPVPAQIKVVLDHLAEVAKTASRWADAEPDQQDAPDGATETVEEIANAQQ